MMLNRSCLLFGLYENVFSFLNEQTFTLCVAHVDHLFLFSKFSTEFAPNSPTRAKIKPSFSMVMIFLFESKERVNISHNSL